MVLRSLILQPNLTHLLPTLKFSIKPSSQHSQHQEKEFSLKISRRVGGLATMASLVLGGEGFFGSQSANASDFAFMVPGLTVEEAQSGAKVHAQDLLQVKELLEAGLWKAAQKALRQSSALLRKDIYAIIQSKPGNERPQLRKLYSTLFNNVSRLDYAARDKDVPEVWRRYENIVVAVNDILSII